MSGSWAKGAPNKMAWGSAAGEGKPAAPSKGMRYVPPPGSAGAGAGGAAGSAAPAPVAGRGKMKYVPPPTNAGAWNRPKPAQKASGGDGTCQWDELAAKEEAQLKAGRKVARAEAKQSNSVGMSGNDKADIAATKIQFDLWTRADVTTAHRWARAEQCRIPNKRVAKGGRLHKLINILLNNCDYVNDRLTSEKRYQDACKDPTMASGLELRRQFVAPLAKKVLNKVEDEEAEQAFQDDDPDSDDSDGRAM